MTPTSPKAEAERLAEEYVGNSEALPSCCAPVTVERNYRDRHDAFLAGYSAASSRLRDENPQITFGYGKVRMSKAKVEGSEIETILVLSDYPEGKPVGAVDEECPYQGRPVSEIPGRRIELWFDNVEGLDALLLSLHDIRAQLLPPTEQP